MWFFRGTIESHEPTNDHRGRCRNWLACDTPTLVLCSVIHGAAHCIISLLSELAGAYET